MALVPCRTTIGTTGSFVRGRDPPTPVIIEKKRIDRRDGFRYAVANAIRTVNVKGFLVVGIVTDPYSGVVGCSRDRLVDPNGIRRRLFEKFFREGVVHDFSQIVFTRLVFWLFLPLLWIPYPDFIAIVRPIAEIGRSGKRPLRAILPVPTASFLLPLVDRFLEMRYQVKPHRGRFYRPTNYGTVDNFGLCES